MSGGKDLEPFSRSVDDMFRRMGMSDPVVMASIGAEWDKLAGSPWSARSKPLYIKGTTLVVEAASASMVAFLRYGEANLVETLAKRFGAGVVDHIDVRVPGAR